MGVAHTINSEHTWKAFVSNARALFDEHKYITYSSPKIGPDRSLTMNALSHVWYSYADKMLQVDCAGDTRRYCKLHFGVPMLRGEDEDFRKAYDLTIKPHDYKTKLGIMDYWPVTSLMSRDQMNRYLTTVQNHYAHEHGLVLESKGEYAKLQREQNQ